MRNAPLICAAFVLFLGGCSASSQSVKGKTAIAQTTQETTATTNTIFNLGDETAQRFVEMMTKSLGPPAKQPSEEVRQRDREALVSLRDDMAFQVTLLSSLRAFIQSELDLDDKDRYYVSFPPDFDVSVYNSIRVLLGHEFSTISPEARGNIHVFYYGLRQINAELDMRRRITVTSLIGAVEFMKMIDANIIKHIDSCLAFHKDGKLTF